MISRYLKSKNIINQILPIINEEELNKDKSSSGYYLHMEEHNGSYYQIKDAFTNYELDKILALCKKLPSKKGTIGQNEIDEDYRKSTVSWVPVNGETEWLYQKLTQCIEHANTVHFQYELSRIEKLQFTHYTGEDGEFYSPHLDSLNGYLVDNRKLTCVLQLSEPNDYEGGILKLHTSKEPHKIQKERGLLTFFPSHTLHECTPVTSGERYTLVGWVCGPRLK